jgi:uncharacterized protein (TIGR00251 family)
MSPSPVRAQSEGVSISVWVVPGSSRSEIVGRHGDKLKIRVTATPEGGRANAEVASLLSEALGVEAKLVAGMSARSKVFHVARLDQETVLRKLGFQ